MARAIYQPAVENTFYVNDSTGFVNTIHYDDEGWWALAWIDAYDWTQNPDYLNMASSIFDDMTNGWDDQHLRRWRLVEQGGELQECRHQ